MRNKLKYDETTDCFLGITSIHLPVVSQFIKFWETMITETEEPSAEIEELCILFKNWTTIKHMNEAFMLDLIHHFYPDVVIKNNSLNVKCIVNA